MKLKLWISAIRDLVPMGVGAFGLVWSQLTGQVNPELLAVYALLIGVPGAANVLELRLKKSSSEASSPCPARESSSSSSNSSRE